MKRSRRPSDQTLAVLKALWSQPADWRYGYDLSKEIGLKSGTLYPVLMRLADEGLLESEWRASARQGAPARHAYRLSQMGMAYVRDIALAGSMAAPEAGPQADHGLAPA